MVSPHLPLSLSPPPRFLNLNGRIKDYLNQLSLKQQKCIFLYTKITNYSLISDGINVKNSKIMWPQFANFVSKKVLTRLLKALIIANKNYLKFI